MDPAHKIDKGICPKCDTSMTKNHQGGFDCFSCGIEYNLPRTESQDMSGKRWFQSDMFGGPAWAIKHNEKKAALMEEEKRAILSFIQRKR